ncbi:MgtC/SapB family protein [Paenarthrobacter nicotinovorans]|uniref:MgtC/SapB family protein n=1 Tax=Paenarthrobacter nicotinovorans TaxID=29320 RepID=A0ABV0GNL5_PAENI|nr:MgtC/SapB family protein [Paenarthrobacter nicotinovorans]
MLQVEWISPSTLTEIVLLVLAFVLSAIVGLERHRQVKSAGLRTHTLVGLGAATFTLVSSYGFSAIIGADVVLDPSRIAAQIVSGVGFLGGGVIFVKQNIVSGLTTAASIWVVAAIGMACGAGMPILATLATALHLCAVTALSWVGRRIPVAGTGRELIVTYKDGRGALRDILTEATGLGYEVALNSTSRIDSVPGPDLIEARMRFNRGRARIDELIVQLQAVSGVQMVRAANDDSD